MSQAAIGSRAEISIGEEATFGTLVTPTDRIVFTGETITNAITPLLSNAIRSDRAVHFRKLGTEAPGGDINFEQTARGYERLYKHALGSIAELNGCDGGVRGQVGTALSGGTMVITTATAANITSFGTTGTNHLGVVWRDTNDNLQYDYLAYGAFNAGTGSFTGVIRDTSNGTGSDNYTTATYSAVGDWVFKRDKTNWLNTIYTKVLEPDKTLPTSLTIELGLDIVYARVSGCRINTLTETCDSNAILTGTVSVLGKDMWIGDFLSADVAIGATTLALNSSTNFWVPASGTVKIGIGSEFSITYTGVSGNSLTGIPATGTGSITAAHVTGEPVYIQQARTTLTLPTVEPFSFVEGSVQAEDYNGAFVSLQVLNWNWSLTNNMVDSKFVYGSSTRADIPEQDRVVTGSITTQFTDMTLYNRFERSTNIRLELRSISGEIINPAAAAANEVPFQKHVIFPKIEFDGTTPVADDKGIITIDLPFTALWNDTLDHPECTVIMVNGTSNS